MEFREDRVDLPKAKKMSGSQGSLGRWTPEEDDLLRSMAAAGEAAVVIARALKRNAESVRKRAAKLKIKLAQSPPGRKVRGT
jgi:hypothetical protein